VADSSPVRQLITELVILANQVIAAHLQALGIPAIYRYNREAEDVQEMINW